MLLSFDISDAAAKHFGETPDAIGRNLVLKAALEDYRKERISEGRFAEVLGVDRWTALEILDAHDARAPYTASMLKEDRSNLAGH